MAYLGRITVVLIYILIVLAWHSFYFLVDFNSSYFFMFEKGLYIWDFIFIPLLSPFFWWLGLQYDRAKFLSEKDFLTEVYNRRYVYGIFHKLVTRINVSNQKLSVFVVDINKFKSINDTYGHEAGDEILQRISLALLNNTRKGDVVARWGGDEFLMITPYTDQAGTLVIIKRIEGQLQELSKPMKTVISVSIGSSTYPNDAKTLDDLIKIADKRMYEVKVK